MSAEVHRARVAICWHLHQPEYRVDGVPVLPWSYLHALRAYADMAAHLEAVTQARVVVTFSPVLLDPLLDVAAQAQNALAGRLPAEPLMAALLTVPTDAARADLLRSCQRAHVRNAHARYIEYARLVGDAGAALEHGDDATTALPEQFIVDLVVWYHLVWLAESVRNEDPRALALLLDFSSALENAPPVPLPEQPYPGGDARARWHLDARSAHLKAIFGVAPHGCWPSEAAVSQATVSLIEAAGFDWLAIRQSVQRATLHHHGQTLDAPGCSHRLNGEDLTCFFRDDGLSDRIGFVYKDWQPLDAVADLVNRLDELARARGGRTVVLALDGENPWEYYPEHGIEFVRGLYAALDSHPRLRMATLSECCEPDLPTLPAVVAGRWVHGQLLTWIGNAEKNRAWSLLIEAKRRYDATPDPRSQAQRLLGLCEGSDWFWWPGEHHPPTSVSDFDTLYRAHLRSLYQALSIDPPTELDQPLARGGDTGGISHALGALLPSGFTGS